MICEHCQGTIGYRDNRFGYLDKVFCSLSCVSAWTLRHVEPRQCAKR